MVIVPSTRNRMTYDLALFCWSEDDVKVCVCVPVCI